MNWKSKAIYNAYVNQGRDPWELVRELLTVIEDFKDEHDNDVLDDLGEQAFKEVECSSP